MNMYSFLATVLVSTALVEAVIQKDAPDQVLTAGQVYQDVPGIELLSHGLDVYGGVSSAERIFTFTYDSFKEESSDDFDSSNKKIVMVDGAMYRSPDQIEVSGPLARCTSGKTTPQYFKTALELEEKMRRFRSYPGSPLFEDHEESEAILVLNKDDIFADYLQDAKQDFNEGFLMHYTAAEFQTYLRHESALSEDFIKAVQALGNAVNGCPATMVHDVDVVSYDQILWEYADIEQDACCAVCLVDSNCTSYLFDTMTDYCWTFRRVESTEEKLHFRLGTFENSTAEVDYALVRNFFKMWGTHYVTEGILGGEIMQLVTFEDGTTATTAETEIASILEDNFEMLRKESESVPAIPEAHHTHPIYYRGGSAGLGFGEWCGSIVKRPELVRYSLKPIAGLFDAVPGLVNADYLQILFNNVLKGRCVCENTDSCDLDTGACVPDAVPTL